MTSTNKRLKASFGGFSTAGVKTENQDAFSALQPSGQQRESKGVTACLADGVSCSENAQQASHMAVAQFIDDYYASPDTWTVKTSVSRLLSSLNDWLFHHDRQHLIRESGYVTTFAGVIIKSTTAHCFHIGDSRIYRYRKGADRLALLTRDHAQTNGGRSFLTRALGMDSHLEVDYKQEDIEPGDIYILTSDGAHNFVSPAEIRQAVEANDNCEQIAKRIVEHALASGSDDNASCLLLRIDDLPNATLDEMHRQLTHLVIPPVMDIGAVIDGYKVKQIIHNGTRSHLYLVQHPEHNCPYVLKAPSESFSDDPQYLDGFIREQWIGLRINHDSIMKMYPSSHDSRFLYLLMEYIEGKTLRQWMHDNPQASLGDMRSILQGVITGMRIFQRMDMVHRDLKPENIMICSDGRIKIIDFGTVKVSGLGEIHHLIEEERPVGSVDYIAPEYLLQNTANFQSDIFSLGIIVYELLSGKLPYQMSHVHRRMPKSVHEWRYQSIRQFNPSIPVWIDSALKKATHPVQTQRYDSYSEFMQDLLKPNATLVKQYQQKPLIERNPVLTWKIISGALLFIIIAQWILLLD